MKTLREGARRRERERERERERRLRALKRCLAAGGEENYVSRVGQFLRIPGHMLEDIGYTFEAMSVGEVEASSHTREEEDNYSLMQRTMQASPGETSGEVEGDAPTTSNACPTASSTGLREEDLTVEDRILYISARVQYSQCHFTRMLTLAQVKIVCPCSLFWAFCW